MRDFKIAAGQKRRPRDRFTFNVDDVPVTTIRPDESLMVMLMSAEASEARSDESRMAGLIDAAMALFDADSRRYLTRRLLDPEDPFQFDHFEGDESDPDDPTLMVIVREVITEWSNRPTKPSSDSTSQSEEPGDDSTENASAKELVSST